MRINIFSNLIFFFFALFLLSLELTAQEKEAFLKQPISDSLKLTFQRYELKNGTIRTYFKPKFWDFVTKAPKDFITTSKDFVAKDHAWYLGASVASTLALIPIDQKINDNMRTWAEENGFSGSNLYGNLGPLKIKPENVGAAFYFVGNGTTVILLASGFLTYGLFKNDYRAQATASGLIESMIVSGVFVQTIKRITGRESPFIAIKNGNKGGDWNPFPSFSAYAKDTPNYDAMPSGHLMTIMSAFSVITTNYPEYKWIKPVGYALIGGMCLQMIQSEVHWASDYPLAFFMGYFVGKSIASSRFKETNKKDVSLNKPKFELIASRQLGANTFGVNIKF